MRQVIKKIIHPFLKRYYKNVGLTIQDYSYKGISIKIYPNVFSPKLTISTKILLKFTDTIPVKNTTFLELGAGSGIVSFYAESKGAKVTATDISDYVIEGLKQNKKKLNSNIKIIKSDLFKNIEKSFDFIFINPPYYPKEPKNTEEKAWFCGEKFEYFESLFSTLNKITHNKTSIYMILSEDCEIEKIKQIATKNNYQLIIERQIIKFGEKNFIFKITNK